MSRCMVLFCSSRGTIPGISYFTLTAKRHDAWCKALGRDPLVEKLSKHNYVCSLHFLDSDKIVQKNKLVLKAGAVPTLILGPRKPLGVLQEQTSSVPSITETDPITFINCDSNINQIKFEPVIEECIIYEDSKIELYENVSPVQLSSSSSTVTCDSPVWKEYNVTSFQEAFNFACAILVTFYYFYKNIKQAECHGSLNNMHFKRKHSPSPSSTTDSHLLKGPTKRARKDIKLLHTHSKHPSMLEGSLKKTQEVLKTTKNKLRGAQRRIGTLVKKVNNLKDIVLQLRKKRMLSDDAFTNLEKSYAGVPNTFIKRTLQNIRCAKRNKKQIRSKFRK